MVPMLTPEKLEQVQRAAVEHYSRNLERLKTIGAVLSEIRTGTVNVDFVIGPEKVEGVKEFRKARIADDKWVDSLIKNADPLITKKQYELAIEQAVLPLPL